MKKQLFSQFLLPVKKAVTNFTNLESFEKGYLGLDESIQTREFYKSLRGEIDTLEPKTAMAVLAELVGIKDIAVPVLGDHPDFAYLRQTGGHEFHNVTSVFIDVSKSTTFWKKYNHEQIALIIQTIVKASTHTCALFGGHIQRLMYDGVMVYFGGKGITKEQANKNAIDATSFFSYFLRYELRDLFEIEDIDAIYTRTGIDWGPDKEVQWLVFGSPGCSELTTNSQHTSFAAKMQRMAHNNGIAVGDNIKDSVNVLAPFCKRFLDSNGNFDQDKRVVKGFDYAVYDFDWQKYLTNTYSFVKSNSTGLYIDYETPEENERSRREAEFDKRKLILDSGAASFSLKHGMNSDNQGTRHIPHEFHYQKK